MLHNKKTTYDQFRMTKGLFAEPTNTIFLLQEIEHSSASAVVSIINTVSTKNWEKCKTHGLQNLLPVQNSVQMADGPTLYELVMSRYFCFICQSSKVLCVELALSSTVWSNQK
jgi:hypothetical protein